MSVAAAAEALAELQPYLKTPAAAARASFVLAIAIPTFNRARELAALLDQLANEVTGLADRVLLVVSNNCSTDGTEVVIGELAECHPHLALEAYRQPRNVGPIPNIHFLVRAARAEWIWCLGDDDLLVDGAVRQVLASLDRDGDDLRLLRTRGVGEWDAIPESGGMRRVAAVTREGAALLMAGGFLASALLRAETWRRLLEPAMAFEAPNYANWVAVLLSVAESGSIAVLDTPVVRGNASMVGEERFARYSVLVLQRLKIWRTLWNAGGTQQRLANALRPRISRLFRRHWLSIAAGMDRSLATRVELWRGFRDGARYLGWRALPALPWLLIVIAVPEPARVGAAQLCRRVLRGR